MKTWLAVAAAVSLCGCGSRDDDINGPGRGTEAFVEGRVTRSGGLPVVGAAVTVTGVDERSGNTSVGNCRGTPHFSTYTDTTDSNGEYLVKVLGPPTENTHCIAVQVTPPAESGLTPKMESGQDVYLRGPGGPVALDTLHIDIAL